MTELRGELAAAGAPLFVTHRHADRDSLGAAIGLQAALDRGTVCTPDGVARSARQLIEATDTEVVTDPEEAAFDTVVVLDSPSTERIAPVDPEEPLLVDHHEPGDLSERAAAALVDTDADATAALVADLLLDTDRALSPEVALPLVVGIFGDTGNLIAASGDTVQLAGDLIGCLGPRRADLPELIGRAPSKSRRTARTLGVLRATGYRAGDWFVAFSSVGAHETATANALRRQGVDLAVVLSEQSDGYRVTARASDPFAGEVNLGDSLLPAVAAEFGGDGGGHDGAGVATVRADDGDAVEGFVRRYVERELGSSLGQVRSR